MNLNGFIDALEQRAAASIQLEQGDYIGDDGLLYCGKCHTPKQCRVTILGQERTPHCPCKCKQERKEAEEEERRKVEIALLAKKLRSEAFPEEEMQRWRFENDDRDNEQLSMVMQKYAELFDDIRQAPINGLVLFGPTGTGKSFIAACVGNELIDRGISVIMTNFDRIRNKVQESFEGRQAYLDKLNSSQLLIIDDLGAESSSEFMQELVFSVIDSRANSGRPMIVTTNLTAEELKSPADGKKKRVYSRLLGMCQPVQVTGPDRRRERLKKESKSIKDLLGL